MARLSLSLRSVEHVHPQLNDPFSKTFLQIFRCAKELLEKEKEQQMDQSIVQQPRRSCFLEPNKKKLVVDDEKTEPSGFNGGEKIEKLKIFKKPLSHNIGEETIRRCYPSQPFCVSVNSKEPLIVGESSTQNPNPNERLKKNKRKPMESHVFLPKKKPKTNIVGVNFNKKKNFVAPYPPPPLPANMAERIRALNGERVELLLYKQLSKTDLSREHNRLFMPMTQIIDKDFLNEEERAYLDKRVMGKPSEMTVRVIQPNCEEILVTFKKWDMKKKNGKTSLMFVFIREWNQLHLSNHLTVDTVLQIWTFRTPPPQGQLCFALVRL